MGKINESEVEWTTLDDGGRRIERKKLASKADGDELGCSLYRLPEGNRSWPYHYHTGNEEALFVLDGTGTLRLNGNELPLESGDYVALPGNERGAHQVINDSPGRLRYLMVSTMSEPEVTVYPDSDKIGVFVGSPPGGEGERSVHGYHRTADAVDYWTDEPDPRPE
ncbi:MAG: cupin domain-containing protein [Natronomonas sp.]